MAESSRKSTNVNKSADPAPGPKRETLTSRAKRIIGRVLDNSDESPPAESSSTRSGIKKSPTRRREQVLQAQRTHRQRTQGYIRELEKEVLRLREAEGKLSMENQTLITKLDIFTHALQTNGIPVPDVSDSPAFFRSESQSQGDLTSNPSGYALSHHGFSSGGDSVSIDLTDLEGLEPHKWCSTTAAYEEPRQYSDPSSGGVLSDDQQSFMTFPLRERTQEEQERGPSVPLGAQAGIDFILELEAPCLPHIKYRYMQGDFKEGPLRGEGSDAAPDFNYGSGHMHMATTALLHSQYAPDPAHETFRVPPADIEQLFHTSLTLDLGPDVTPIQVWANVRRISQKYPVDKTMLGMIREEFSKYIRCNSFGAVLERTTANAVLAFFFPGEEFTTSWE